MARHLDGDGMPLDAPSSLVHELNDDGIKRLIVGHTPHGTCPTVIKSGGEMYNSPQLEVILADTSYSDTSAPDSRGGAVSEVVLYPDSTVRILGVLQDSSTYDYTLGQGVGKPDEIVGLLETPWWGVPKREADGKAMPRFVKAKLSNGKYLMCRVTDGFKYQYSTLPKEEAYEAVGVNQRLEAWERT